MTGHLFLDAALLSVSIFNAILMLWLGVTVLLNAGHRAPGSRSGAWGFWIAAVGLSLGGSFFLLHTVLLGFDFSLLAPAWNVWWRAIWITVVLLPFSWYAVMLWYSGFWERDAGGLFRRHRPWFLFCSASALAWVVIALVSNPVPIAAGWNRSGPANAGGGFPGVLLAYPPFIVLYIGLAFDALRRPGPTARLMGAAARLRARPWFAAASIVFLAVCLVVGFAELWFLWNTETGWTAGFLTGLGILDLATSLLIGLATLLLGQAIMAYEVFTGRILPRRGLARYWRNAVLLAAGYGLLVGGGLAGRLLPVVIVLLATVLMTVFYALLGRRSYTERDSFLEVLRPFVASQEMYERLTAAPESPADAGAAAPFRALCADILGCERAALVAVGPMAPLWGAPLTYPDAFAVAPIPAPPAGSERAPAALDDRRGDRLRWALTLWSRRGPIGLLLLSEKRDGGLYTQEDFEIAQAACERFIDTQTSAELTRRLIAIQRERLMGSRILDRKTRRVLHDEILPALHTAILGLGAPDPDTARALTGLSAVHRRIARLLQEMPSPPPAEDLTGGVVAALRSLLAGELPGAFDAVAWRIDPPAEAAARELPPMQLEVVYYAAREAVRNAARYGRGDNAARPLRLTVGLTADDALRLSIEDDGVGLQPGLRAQDAAGQGLALHGTMMAVIGGQLSVERGDGGGTRVRLSLPIQPAGAPPIG
jgi:signal transduction histidine kinase